MKTTTRFAALAGLAIATTALFASPAVAAGYSHPSAAVFVQTDNLGGNTVVAYDRTANGTLTQAGTYATGGLGGILTGSVVDHLASQGSLAFDRVNQLLYAVNAGSDSITVFRVHGDKLVKHEVISSGGSFPVSVTFHGNLVYVANARDGGSVQGFYRFGDSLIRIPSWHRSLGLDVTEAPEFTHTPGQIAFTPDGSKLVVTTKANGNDIDVYAVGALGGLSSAPVVNLEDGTVPFGVTFDSAGHLVVAATGTGAVVTYQLHHNGTVTELASAATGQAATCWIAPARGYFYTSNAGSATVSGFTAGSLAALGNTGTDAGTVDAAASSNGHYLYVQTGAAGIVDEFAVGAHGSLTALGSVTVPNATGGEGIATS
jgi:hypothetical protein